MGKRKEITLEVPYFEKGEEKTKLVKIKYVSYSIQNRYSDILNTINSATKLAEQERSILREIGALISVKKLPLRETRAKIKDLNEQKEKVHTQLLALEPKTGDTYNKLIQITKDLLEMNGNEDEELSSTIFWEDKVEAEEIWSFLLKAVSKDATKDIKAKK